MTTIGHVPDPLDIQIYRGDFWGVKFTEPTLGAFAPGDTFSAQVRDKEDDTIILIDFLFNTSLLSSGILTMYYVNTAALTFSKGVWDLQRVRAGEPLTIWAGSAKVTKDVTRP